VPTHGNLIELTSCAACSGGISEAAMWCPHCGHPGPAAAVAARRKVVRGQAALALAGAVFILLGLVSAIALIALVLGLAFLIAFGFSLRSDRVAIVGGRCVLGICAVCAFLLLLD